jgi:4-deoxy-L-threo-5-hexosulose-uronate ketol-isomerase
MARRHTAAAVLLVLLCTGAAAAPNPPPRRSGPKPAGAVSAAAAPQDAAALAAADAAARGVATVKLMEEPSAAGSASLSSADLRSQFLVPGLLVPGQVTLTYTTIDRMVIGGAAPLPGAAPLALRNSTGAGIRKGPLLANRELAVFNLGPGKARVVADGEAFILRGNDTLYVPAQTAEVLFSSIDEADQPARLFLVSAPCGVRTKAVKIPLEDPVAKFTFGGQETADARTMYRLLGPTKAASCQLTLGVTFMAAGSVWNQQPAHLHERRSEVYFYYDMKPDTRVFHMLGEKAETRHVIVKNEEAVLCPPWSMHFGVGTGGYAMLWAMAGENQEFDDKVPVQFDELL